ncbi:MAG: hypothetical protein AAB263_18300, partial [Planctomycetota bacterium]
GLALTQIRSALSLGRAALPEASSVWSALRTPVYATPATAAAFGLGNIGYNLYQGNPWDKDWDRALLAGGEVGLAFSGGRALGNYSRGLTGRPVLQGFASVGSSTLYGAGLGELGQMAHNAYNLSQQTSHVRPDAERLGLFDNRTYGMGIGALEGFGLGLGKVAVGGLAVREAGRPSAFNNLVLQPGLTGLSAMAVAGAAHMGYNLMRREAIFDSGVLHTMETAGILGAYGRFAYGTGQLTSPAKALAMNLIPAVVTGSGVWAVTTPEHSVRSFRTSALPLMGALLLGGTLAGSGVVGLRAFGRASELGSVSRFFGQTASSAALGAGLGTLGMASYNLSQGKTGRDVWDNARYFIGGGAGALALGYGAYRGAAGILGSDAMSAARVGYAVGRGHTLNLEAYTAYHALGMPTWAYQLGRATGGSVGGVSAAGLVVGRGLRTAGAWVSQPTVLAPALTGSLAATGTAAYNYVTTPATQRTWTSPFDWNVLAAGIGGALVGYSATLLPNAGTALRAGYSVGRGALDLETYTAYQLLGAPTWAYQLGRATGGSVGGV